VRAPLCNTSFVHRRAKGRARGFTLIEVMMALTILTIGILGIISMQKSAVVTNNDAQQFTTATQIARGWIDRLMRDAALWNSPSSNNPSSDIGDTFWLQNVTGTNAGQWILPTMQTYGDGRVESPAFDRDGNDVTTATATTLTANTVYCTNIRLQYIFPDQLIRAEVRVFWRKREIGDSSLYTGYALTNGICTQVANGVVAQMGQDTSNFRWVYAVAAIPRQGPR
jgi:prepilin-type N-terminal cleavage/methylation domain-containing protein